MFVVVSLFSHSRSHLTFYKWETCLTFKRLLFLDLERVFGLSDGPLKDAPVFFFLFALSAVGGLLPLCTKPLSDCKAVKRSPISTGNSGFQVQVYSAHATTLQRLVITICSGLYILTSWLTVFCLVFSSLLIHLPSFTRSTFPSLDQFVLSSPHSFHLDVIFPLVKGTTV